MVDPIQMGPIKLAYERRGKGVCVTCGVPVATKETEWIRCDECIQKIYLRHMERKRPDQCRTSTCSGTRVEGKKRCAKCLAQDLARYYARTATLEGKVAHASTMARTRAKKIEAGLCTYSGCDSTFVPGKKSCQKHLDYYKQRERK